MFSSEQFGARRQETEERIRVCPANTDNLAHFVVRKQETLKKHSGYVLMALEPLCWNAALTAFVAASQITAKMMFSGICQSRCDQ